LPAAKNAAGLGYMVFGQQGGQKPRQCKGRIVTVFEATLLPFIHPPGLFKLKSKDKFKLKNPYGFTYYAACVSQPFPTVLSAHNALPRSLDAPLGRAQGQVAAALCRPETAGCGASGQRTPLPAPVAAQPLSAAVVNRQSTGVSV